MDDCCSVKLNTLPLKIRERLTVASLPLAFGAFWELSSFSEDDDGCSSLSAAMSLGSTADIVVARRLGALDSARIGADITISSCMCVSNEGM